MQEFIDKLMKRLEEKQIDVTGNTSLHHLYSDGFSIGIECAMEIIKELAEQHNNGWISVNDRLPEDCDNRSYMCIVENHEEDLPMFCQYDEEYGFGFWHDIYDEQTLGFVDSEFRTNEELGYEKVVAWQLPPAYKEGGV